MTGFAQERLQERLLTVDEAAARLRVSPATVYRYVRTGRLPAARVADLGPWRIPAGELEALLRPARREAGR